MLYLLDGLMAMIGRVVVGLCLSASTAPGAAGQSFDKSFRLQHLAPYEGRGFEWENSPIGISDKAPPPWPEKSGVHAI